ncbi:putative small auxin-up RNA [Helianthus annuus]|nr:putative small auxin-up RNA [Helianthus annuus]KAJ0813433.1 putative small auxin-up RNA [Helianthus annuus]
MGSAKRSSTSGEKEKRRFVVPISYLEKPLFQNLLHESEEEFGFDHSMGGLTLSCQEDMFFSSHLYYIHIHNIL